ncbi:TerB family tellurite resistance protein [uncultured Gilvimarinus sp.]|uniref:tellurite resistance TerB family protein n=1 Tax=uncultured Gilvimarinus sp. TaxID=1689143 RepID=UPI0030EE09C8|tara:strand:- start:3188 stop:3652 length:465 start_codon:yes stop_codon:yes gene_type:complete
MLNRLTQFFERHLQTDGAEEELSFSQKQLAAAALLMEVAAVDRVFEDVEFDEFKRIVAQVYQIADDDIEELCELARDKQDQATSLFQFTQLINDHCSNEEKFTLVKSMWQIALADGDLDKYEEHLIRRVAELIYLSHTDFLVARNAAREQSGAS